METNKDIVNKVSNSGLVEINPLDYYLPGERVLFDVAPLLHQGLILREADIREFVRSHEWTQYSGKFVAITCSVDAIIPSWAFMLIASGLSPFASEIVFGGLDILEKTLLDRAIAKIDLQSFTDARVIVKGCGDKAIDNQAFVLLTARLMPVVKSIFYGEPCSTVPVSKRK